MHRVMDTLKDERWIGIKIRHEKPYVDRIWLQIGNQYRLCLHKIYPLVDGETAFYHPHPWEFEAFIAKGSYFSNIGCNSTPQERQDLTQPPIASRIMLAEGSWYLMDNTNTWHTVEPIANPVYSVVLTKRRWNVKVPRQCHVQNNTMNQEEVTDLLQDFNKILGEKCPSLTYSQTRSPGLFEQFTSPSET